MIQPLRRTVWRVLKKLKIELPYEPAIPLLGIYLGKNVIQKDTCTIYNSQDMQQPKCPLTEEWIKKMWYIYTMAYYSAIKRNKIGSFVETWMDLETVIQSEVKSEREKQIY